MGFDDIKLEKKAGKTHTPAILGCNLGRDLRIIHRIVLRADTRNIRSTPSPPDVVVRLCTQISGKWAEGLGAHLALAGQEHPQPYSALRHELAGCQKCDHRADLNFSTLH